MNDYDDIINLPHHVSKKHKPMSLYNRAAQFSPFAALVGYDEVIIETGRITSDEVQLSEDKINEINNYLVYINNHKEVIVSITYYVKDKTKKGGSYQKITGTIKKIDMDKGIIVFEDKNKIVIKDIVDIAI